MPRNFRLLAVKCDACAELAKEVYLDGRWRSLPCVISEDDARVGWGPHDVGGCGTGRALLQLEPVEVLTKAR